MRLNKEWAGIRSGEGGHYSPSRLEVVSSHRLKRRPGLKYKERKGWRRQRPTECVSLPSGNGDLESTQMLLDFISQGDGGSALIYSFNKRLMSAYNMWHTQTGTRCTPGRVFLHRFACSGHQNPHC